MKLLELLCSRLTISYTQNRLNHQFLRISNRNVQVLRLKRVPEIEMSLTQIHSPDDDWTRSLPDAKCEDGRRKRLWCHQIDSYGNLNSHSVHRITICRSLELQPRDLRKLDGTVREGVLPIIMVRPRAILMHMESISAIIKHDGVILIDTSNGILLEN